MSKRKERMPKKEYFQMRLNEAVINGNTDKANYYRGRIEQIEKDELERFIEEDHTVTLQPVGLFGSRETIDEALEYADMMAKSMESPIHAITPVFVLFNTIANNYDLIPKQK
jgi:hypothetical protein